jgi:hypothetical protein
VIGRTNPGLIDLISALATGTVGAFALVRADVSDTLPGVAIAISLEPPLAVMGLLLEADRYPEAAGALLLFGTNVTAIIAPARSCCCYRVRDVAQATGAEIGQLRGRALIVVAALVALVAVPLSLCTAQIVTDRLGGAAATPIATEWAEAQGWRVASIQVRDGTIRLVAFGPPPEVDPSALVMNSTPPGSTSTWSSTSSSVAKVSCQHPPASEPTDGPHGRANDLAIGLTPPPSRRNDHTALDRLSRVHRSGSGGHASSRSGNRRSRPQPAAGDCPLPRRRQLNNPVATPALRAALAAPGEAARQ